MFPTLNRGFVKEGSQERHDIMVVLKRYSMSQGLGWSRSRLATMLYGATPYIIADGRGSGCSCRLISSLDLESPSPCSGFILFEYCGPSAR